MGSHRTAVLELGPSDFAVCIATIRLSSESEVDNHSPAICKCKSSLQLLISIEKERDPSTPMSPWPRQPLEGRCVSRSTETRQGGCSSLCARHYCDNALHPRSLRRTHHRPTILSLLRNRGSVILARSNDAYSTSTCCRRLDNHGHIISRSTTLLEVALFLGTAGAYGRLGMQQQQADDLDQHANNARIGLFGTLSNASVSPFAVRISNDIFQVKPTPDPNAASYTEMTAPVAYAGRTFISPLLAFICISTPALPITLAVPASPSSISHTDQIVP